MNDLEKLFKDGLSDFEEATPSKSLWWRISTSLFMKKYFGKTILLAALLSMIGIYSINQVFFNDTIQKTTATKTVANEAVALNQPSANNTTKVENKDVQVENSVSKSNTVQEEKQISKNQISNNKSQIPNSKSQITNNKTQNSNQPPFRAGEKLISTNTKSQITNSKTQNSNSKNQIPSFNNRELSGTEVQIQNTNNRELSGVEVQLPKVEQQTIPKTHSTPINQNLPIQEQEVVSSNQEVLISSIEYQKPKDWQNIQTFLHPNPILIPFILRPKHHSRFIEVYAGPTFNQTNLSTSDPKYDEYVRFRNNAESQKITPNFGINYRQNFKNWFITGGASYHQIRTDADYQLPINVVDSSFNFFSIVRMNYSYQVIGSMPDPNNPNVLIPIYGTISNPDTSHYTEVFYDTNSVLKNFHYTQKYTYIEIPLMFGREFHYKNFVFETGLGVSYSRLTKYETKLPDLTTKNLLNDLEVENILVQNTFNGIIGVGAAYQVTENKSVFIRPEFKYNLNSMFNKSYPISQHNSHMRIVMGIRYEL